MRRKRGHYAKAWNRSRLRPKFLNRMPQVQWSRTNDHLKMPRMPKRKTNWQSWQPHYLHRQGSSRRPHDNFKEFCWRVHQCAIRECCRQSCLNSTPTVHKVRKWPPALDWDFFKRITAWFHQVYQAFGWPQRWDWPRGPNHQARRCTENERGRHACFRTIRHDWRPACDSSGEIAQHPQWKPAYSL